MFCAKHSKKKKKKNNKKNSKHITEKEKKSQIKELNANDIRVAFQPVT